MRLLGEGPTSSTGQHPGGQSQQTLVAQAEALKSSDRAVQQRRRDAEQHQYREIWTKDAHGGPYHKAVTTTGYDALDMPNGTEVKPAIGYEKPQGGPTTNFVGNHMTQGAIDLVQAQLEGLGTASAAKCVEDPTPVPPRLISTTPASPQTSTRWETVESFSWADESDNVRVVVPTGEKDNKDIDAKLTVTETSLRLELTEARTRKHRVLQISQLFARVVPEQCYHRSVANGRSGATVVEVILPKALRGESWVSLRGQIARKPKMITSSAGTAPVGGEVMEKQQQPPPTLESLRLMVRSNRKPNRRLAASARQKPNCHPFPGTLEDSIATILSPEQIPQTAQEANTKAAEMEATGDYAAASELYCWATKHLSKDSSVGVAYESWMGFGRSSDQLGNLPAAADAFSTASSLAANLGVAQQAAAMVLQGCIFEQDEKLEQARQIFKQALLLTPSHAGASDGLRRVAALLNQMGSAATNGPKQNTGEQHVPAGPGLMPSLPRPGMAVFKNRGKAGKPF